MIPLYTSIPTKMSRQAQDGSEVDHQYATECIRSWRRSGFRTFTVNSRNESPCELIHSEQIQTITVDRDAKTASGKPLILFEDFISAICQNSDGPVAITNADILLEVSKASFKQLENLQPGECFVAKRMDISDPMSRNGREFSFGYDLFVYHTADLRGLARNDFVIGQPWWDHFLPIYMFLLGLRPLKLEGLTAYHLEHSERWEPGNWIRFGSEYIDTISRVISHPHLASPQTTDFEEAFSRAMTLQGHQSRAREIKLFLRNIYRRDASKQTQLQRVAAANVSWIDKQRLGGNPL